MTHKDTVDQARADTLKTIRAIVRLRHSLNADRELNDVLPKAQMAFDKSVLKGILPEIADIKRAVGL